MPAVSPQTHTPDRPSVNQSALVLLDALRADVARLRLSEQRMPNGLRD